MINICAIDARPPSKKGAESGLLCCVNEFAFVVPEKLDGSPLGAD